MNCTRLLQGLPSSILPADTAMRLCLKSSPPLHSLLGNYESVLFPGCEQPRPCLASGPQRPEGGGRTAVLTVSGKKKKKKSVVFADARGMALTDVHLFDESEEDLLAELQFHLTDLEGATSRLSTRDDQGSDQGAGPSLVLVPIFSLPAADYLGLRRRLKAQQVALESCSVQERSLSGTVKVQNIGFEKSVSVRITFDSWCSFRDIPCRYLNDVYACPETDTFSFSDVLPESLHPSHQVEFCVHYEAQDQSFWDNNDGNNYILVACDPDRQRVAQTDGLEGGEGGGGCGREMEFDQFGSPRTSAGIFPEWQSWVRAESGAPYW